MSFSSYLLIPLLAFFVSLLSGLLILRLQHLHGKFTVDHTVGPQKFHTHNAIRIGGVPILLGWTLGSGAFYLQLGFNDYLIYFVTSLPVFIFGLIEDTTRKVKPRIRLFAAFTSAGLMIYLMNILLNRLGLPWVDDYVLSLSIVSVIFTIFCVGGVTHAFNIIDGYNGLSGMVSVLVLIGFSICFVRLNDVFLLTTCLTLIASILGFLVWNYPRGLLFAGDSGAYLMGYLIASISVISVARHPEISPWFPMMLVIYPVFETIFSMYRRKFLQGRSTSYSDRLHLHSLIYKRIVRIKGKKHQVQRNALTSPYLWVITFLTGITAVCFWNNTPALLIGAVIYMFIYVLFYRRLIKFKVPRFLIIGRKP